MKQILDRLESQLQAIEPIRLPFRWTLTGSRNAPEDLWHPVVIAMTLLVKRYLDPCHTRPLKRCCHVLPSHGGARGMDTWFDQACRSAGWNPTKYEVSQEEWNRFGGYAGARRNGFMLRAERPHLCTALVHNSSRGSTGCAMEARTLGIPVLQVTEEDLLAPPDPRNM